jgi:hypothetical protein
MNPMQEFKKNFTKEYSIQGHTFLFRSLSTKESNEVEKAVARQTVSINDDSTFNTRKIETLAVALVSVDGTPLNKFEDIQVEVSKGGNEKELVKAEIESWDDSFSSLLYLYYLDLLKQKDAKYEKEAKFLNSSN